MFQPLFPKTIHLSQLVEQMEAVLNYNINTVKTVAEAKTLGVGYSPTLTRGVMCDTLFLHCCSTLTSRYSLIHLVRGVSWGLNILGERSAGKT